jgi:hypothetical protein
MTTPHLAPSLISLRRRVNELWPKRDKRSDGWLGDASHQARQSDHNPDAGGMVHALDIDRDGINVPMVLNELIGHPAVEYVIHHGQIWWRGRDWEPKRYTGPNAHESHIHVSIRHTHAAEHWGGTWLPQGEGDMSLSDDDLRKIATMTAAQIDAAIPRIVSGLLGARIETYHDKNLDGRRDVETVAQALAGAHSDAWFARGEVGKVLTALQAEARAGE